MRLMLAAILLLAASAYGADVQTPSTAPTAEKRVTISASERSVTDVLKEIAAQSGETILVEKLVGGSVTANVKDAPVETVLGAVAKSAKIQWRRVYVAQGSVLAKDADALAAQMRTVLALRFPDILISEQGAGGSFVHVQREAAANDLVKLLPKNAGLTPVYLVTDDAKAYKKEVRDASKKKVQDYVTTQKQLMNEFLDMSPEERAAVLKESQSLMNQMTPEVIGEMLASIYQTNPDFMTEQSKLGMRAIFSMSPEARKNMLRETMRQNIEMMNSLTPEQLQEFQEIAAEIAAGRALRCRTSNS
ncbi:MAG: hypothetical protein HYX78_08420 [Armatimonadetes bacterium]|nr:hypothetical protein [Armatimonadota bacterium]